MNNLLISGGSRGIGAATVRLFAGSGWNVTYLYRHEALVTGDNITPIKCDVSDYAQVMDHKDKIPACDCLISCAGISLKGLVQDMDLDDYRNVMDTNFGGFYNLVKLVVPSMISAHKGSIIAISSMWGQTGASCEALYSASKGAVDAYVKSLAKELGPSGIRVNAISPGVIDTDMMSCFSDEDKEQLINDTPAGRLGTPEDIAKAAYFLASDGSSYITGQILGVNGGFLI